MGKFKSGSRDTPWHAAGGEQRTEALACLASTQRGRLGSAAECRAEEALACPAGTLGGGLESAVEHQHALERHQHALELLLEEKWEALWNRVRGQEERAECCGPATLTGNLQAGRGLETVPGGETVGRTGSSVGPWGYNSPGPEQGREPRWAAKARSGHTSWSDPDSPALGQMGPRWGPKQSP